MNQLFPYRTEIRLETLNDIHKFVEVVSKINSPVYLEDGENFRVNAKSIIGAIASLEWEKLICVSADDIYSKIVDFVKAPSLT